MQILFIILTFDFSEFNWTSQIFCKVYEIYWR